MEKSTEEAQKADEAYNNLKTTFENYNELKENISDIDDEYERTKAVQDQNKEILDLILNIEN